MSSSKRLEFSYKDLEALNEDQWAEIMAISDDQAFDSDIGDDSDADDCFDDVISNTSSVSTRSNQASCSSGPSYVSPQLHPPAPPPWLSPTPLIAPPHASPSVAPPIDGVDFELPENDVPDTDTKTPAIPCGDTQIMPIEIRIPSNIQSLEHSNIVSREYQVRIEVALPMPHRNIVLTIPVQIGTINEVREHNMEGNSEEMSFGDPPPSYWEAMGETNKEGDNESDDENNTEKHQQ